MKLVVELYLDHLNKHNKNDNTDTNQKEMKNNHARRNNRNRNQQLLRRIRKRSEEEMATNHTSKNKFLQVIPSKSTTQNPGYSNRKNT